MIEIKKPDTTRRPQLGVVIDEDIIAKLDELAQQHKVTRSEVTRQLLTQALEDLAC